MTARASAATLSTLLKVVSIDDHEEILKAAVTALNSFPQDHNIRQTQVVALLKLDRFSDALRVIDEGGAEFRQRCLLEGAYAYYKTGQLSKARECLQPALAAGQRGVLHLDAQVAYRAEKFADASKTYRILSSKYPDHEESHDLKINELAALAQLGWQSREVLEYPQGDLDKPDTFEVAYNAACIYLSYGFFEEAVKFLSLAKRLCDASEDLSDEEKQEEILPILIQLGYTYFRMGLKKAAADVYSSIDLFLNCDADSAFLRKLNSTIVTSDEASPFFLERTIRDSVHPKENSGLFNYQRDLLDQLKYNLSLNCQNFKGVQKRTADTVLKSGPSIASSLNRLSVLNTAASLQLNAGVSTVGTCRELLKQRPWDIGLLLTTVRFYVQEHKLSAACGLVENFISLLAQADSREHRQLRFTPALVALLVSLYKAQGRQRSIPVALLKLLASGETPAQELHASLLRELGLSLLMSQHELEELQAAAVAFQALLEKEPSDDVAAAGVVASCGPSGDNNRQSLLAQLSPVGLLVDGTQVQSLLSGGVVLPSSTAIQTKRKALSDLEKPAKKRRRKVVGDVEAGKQLDPERWLPLRDRTSYRPKGKKGKKRAAETTQGGIVKEETIELVGGAGAVKVEKAAPVSQKKKRKGRK